MKTLPILAVILATQSALNVWLRARDVAWVPLPTQAPGKEEKRTDARTVKALSFGHWPSVVDWLWIQALQDPSLQPVAEGEQASIAPLLQLATDLDPAFFNGLYHGSILLSIVRSDGLSARDLLLKGEHFRSTELPGYPASFQDDEWRGAAGIPMLLGYVYLYDLEDLPAAAQFYRTAAAQPDAPVYLKQLSQRLRTREGQYESGIKFLTQMSSSEKDPELRARILKRRDDLYLGLYLHELNQSFRQFLHRLPHYQSLSRVPAKDLNKFWMLYRKKFRVAKRDPFGGELQLDESGRIKSSTHRTKVFGLE